MISIIIPVFNVQNYIKRCIDSILLQSFEDWELLLIDDGSTDNSFEICKKYVNEKINLFHKNNGGVSSARNYGLKKSKGDYIVFIDADDYVDKNYLKNLYDNIRDNDLVVSGYKEVYSNGKVNKRNFGKKDMTMEYIKNKFDELYLSNFLNSPFNKLYKKSLINCTFNENQILGEDLLFNLQYIKNCKNIISINNTDYNYVINNTSATNKYNSKAIYNYLFIKKELENMCKKMNYCENGSINEIFLKNICGCIQLLLESDNKYNYKVNELKSIKYEIKNQNIYISKANNLSTLQKIIYYLFRKDYFLFLYLFINIRKILKLTYRLVMRESKNG